MTSLSTLTDRIRAQAPADKYILWAALVLGAVGVVAVYSAITFLAETGANGNTEQFLGRHVVRLGLALGAVLVFSWIDYRTVGRYSRFVLVIALGLLLAVQVVGVVSGGAARWLDFGVVGFQPSDLARVALIIYVGVLLAQKQAYVKSLGRSFLPLLFWVGLTVLFIGMEDLSMAAVTFVAAMLMCFVGRVSTVQIGTLSLIGVLLASLLLMESPSRAARVEAFIGQDIFPHTTAEQVFDEQTEGYQAQQARIAFAMGGLTGVGPGKSVQRDFLPTPYNDFIFAIIAEEYGVIGAMGLLLLFCVLLFRGFLRVARHAPDPLGLFLAVGCTTMIVLYGFIHAGVASGLLPVTGLPMPLVSYGGTSMVTTGAMLGILLNISRQARPAS